MENNQNNFDYDYDNVREPDKVIKDCLLGNDNDNDNGNYTNSYDQELNEAMELSLNEIIHINDEQSTYEKFIIENYEKILKERKATFAELTISMNRIKNFDKNILELYEIIEPIIELYCNQHIEKFTVDNLTHKKIFSDLKTLRINKKIIELLQNIITIE